MYSYSLLEPGCHYLVQEKEGDPIILIKVTVESDHCLFVTRFMEFPEPTWKKKTDILFDIIECLTDEKVKEWDTIYNQGADAYHEEEDDE